MGRLLAHIAHQVLKLLQQKPQQCGAIKTAEFI